MNFENKTGREILLYMLDCIDLMDRNAVPRDGRARRFMLVDFYAEPLVKVGTVYGMDIMTSELDWRDANGVGRTVMRKLREELRVEPPLWHVTIEDSHWLDAIKYSVSGPFTWAAQPNRLMTKDELIQTMVEASNELDRLEGRTEVKQRQEVGMKASEVAELKKEAAGELKEERRERVKMIIKGKLLELQRAREIVRNCERELADLEANLAE